MSNDSPTQLVEVEKKFDYLSDLTNKLALMNTDYGHDIDKIIEEIESFVSNLKTSELEKMNEEQKNYYLSHMSFHREIIAEIIADARALLIEKNKLYLKRLVSYHRGFCHWLTNMEKKF